MDPDILYVNTSNNTDGLTKEIQKVLSKRGEDVDLFLGENYDSFFKEVYDVIEGDYFVLSIFTNEEYDEIKSEEFPDGYLFFKYILAFEYTDFSKEKEYIDLISTLMNTFWDSGMRVVAICEFSELLPNEGGYNKRINY